MVYIREIKEEDIEILYFRLNFEYVNKYFKDRESELKRLYFDYYRELLISDKNLVYIIEDDKKKFLGIIRFDLNFIKKSGDIAIYFDIDFRHKGHFSHIMDKSIEKLKEDKTDIEILKAYILEENIISIKAFEKLGFKFKRKVYYKGVKHNLYERLVDWKLDER